MTYNENNIQDFDNFTITFNDELVFDGWQITVWDGLSGTEATYTSVAKGVGFGDFVSGGRLVSRDISLEMEIPWELSDTYVRYFKALSMHKLSIGERYINVMVKSADLTHPDGTWNKPHIRLELYAPDTLFFGEDGFGQDILLATGLFGFEWALPNDEDGGISFGYGEFGVDTIYENVGDYAVGFNAEIRSTGGSITNPRLRNTVTGEFISLNVEVPFGSTLVINTEQLVTEHGAKKQFIELDGESVAHLMNPFSTLFLFDVGDNTLVYEADDGVNNSEVVLTYRPVYANGLEVRGYGDTLSRQRL